MLDKLKDKVIINKSDIKKILTCNDDYAYTILSRLNKKNKIKKIKKGSYTTKDNIYLIANNLHYPSYISFWSLISFYGFTEQILNKIQIVTTKKYRNINFENYKIDFIKVPKKYFFGFYKKKIDSNYIFLADYEKLLIDCLLFEEKIGNYDEIITFLKEININKKKLIEYLKKINNNALNRKTGFLLEYSKKIDLIKYFNVDNNYYLLFKDMKGNFTNTKWRIKHDFKK